MAFRVRLLALALVSALIAVGCGTATEAASSSAVDLALLDAEFDDWAAPVPGGAVGLVRFADGVTHLVDAGEDADTGEPLSASDDRVRVGSISKTFTAVLVLQMVEAGDVALDEPVATYIDGVPFDPTITVADLLGHRSGIPNYTESAGFLTRIIESPEVVAEPEDIFSFVDGEQDFAPGAQFSYSNTNFIVAGELIEAVTGQPLDDVLQERIAEPLGLTQTGFDDGTFDDVASGYSAITPEGSSGARDYTSIATGAWAAGSLVTTVSELATFIDAVFVGDFLEPDSVAQMIAGLDAGAEYGLGAHPGPDFGVGHGGAIIGFNSVAQIDLETGAIVIVSVNNDGRRADVASSVLADFAGLSAS